MYKRQLRVKGEPRGGGRVAKVRRQVAHRLERLGERVDRAGASRTGRTPSQLAGNKLFDDSDPDEFVKGRPNEADLEKNSQGNAGYYASVFTQCLQLHMSDEGMYELMVDPSIGKMAAELAGVQGIRIWLPVPTALSLDRAFC